MPNWATAPGAFFSNKNFHHNEEACIPLQRWPTNLRLRHDDDGEVQTMYRIFADRNHAISLARQDKRGVVCARREVSTTRLRPTAVAAVGW